VREAKGIALIIVMMIAVLLLISLTAVLPSVYQEGQREKEEELKFRGYQYARAVALFHRQFNRYPVSVKELMGTNGIHFLRKEYTDPMDKKGKWRFIHVNAAGVLIDSKNQPMNGPNLGNNPAGLGSQSGLGNQSSFGGQSSFGNQSSFGGQSRFGGSSFGGSSFGGQNQVSPGLGQTIGESNSTTPQSSSTSQSSSSFFGNNNEVQGAFIVGVAATSHHESIKVWNKKHHYDEWEFIGMDMGVFGIQVGVGGGGGQNIQNPMGPQNPGATPQTPFGQTPFGQSPGTSPGIMSPSN
jgi:hypothetical protein